MKVSISSNSGVVVLPVKSPADNSGSGKKSVPCRQDAIDALPPGSGDWVVEGVPGLFVRCGAKSKVFRVQRRVKGVLVRRVLGEMTAAAARREAIKAWSVLKPRPPEGRTTLAEAWERYLEDKPLAPSTRALYEYHLRHYLREWAPRSLEEVGSDRQGVRSLYQRVLRRHGLAVANQMLRIFRAVYSYYRRAQPELPETPTVAVDMRALRPRDWALPADQLRQWWAAVEKLNPLKRTFWLTLLLTGARRGSVEALRWQDLDLDRGVIHFSTAKAGRTYTIPACRRLVGLLYAWQEECPPTESGWVFPSPQRPGSHLAGVRDDKRGVASAHHLRHTYRTTLAELGATPDQARLLLGHSLGGDVSRGYITAHLVVESLRLLADAVAERYAEILGW